jgi:hypothetical protein
MAGDVAQELGHEERDEHVLNGREVDDDDVPPVDDLQEARRTNFVFAGGARPSVVAIARLLVLKLAHPAR